MKQKFDYQKYWDKKFEYFVENEGMNNENRRDIPNFEEVEPIVSMLEIEKNEKVLDMGCGIGRLFPFVLEAGAQVVGVDVSPRMIEEANRRFGDDDNVETQVMNCEQINFDDNTFDKIICYAVFDGIELQADVLREVYRVLKPGKMVVLTGKHKPYRDDDEEAKYAEKKAAEVNHPNFFTDWNEFENTAAELNFEFIKTLIYEKRGDMATQTYTTVIPEQFYEFTVLLRK